MPPRWSDLRRHLRFWEYGDIQDIISSDWPAIFPVLIENLYDDDEPLPVAVSDLADFVDDNASSKVVTELNWSALNPTSFERVIFNLITDVEGYQNPQWLSQTNAPDRGRDLSVERNRVDPLSGVQTQRAIIQCKHYLKTSVAIAQLAEISTQMALWCPPVVDIVIIATSGHFTSDAVDWIEKNNASGQSPRIEMWSHSHLETLLARRPELIEKFQLRSSTV